MSAAMELDGARTLVVGASGVLGGRLCHSLHQAGARLVLAGRDEQALGALSEEFGGVPTRQFDAFDPAGGGGVVDAAADALGGLDLLVVAVGVAGFGSVTDTDIDEVNQLLAVNTVAPIALTRAALGRLEAGATVAVLSAVLADYPTAGMAAYSASKAAISAWLTALRHEQRRGQRIRVFDIRPPHMDTGLADRALGGPRPSLPDPFDVDLVVEHIVAGLREGRGELHYDLQRRELRTR